MRMYPVCTIVTVSNTVMNDSFKNVFMRLLTVLKVQLLCHTMVITTTHPIFHCAYYGIITNNVTTVKL